MHLRGSCHCGAVRFRLTSSNPVPYQRCYCTICRKTQGGGGFAMNIAGDAKSLLVEGRDHVTIYHATFPEGVSDAERAFCSNCGSGLWLFSPDWPDLIHPFASAIDGDLPVPPEHTHMMLGSRAGWAEVQAVPGDLAFEAFPDESIAAWHGRTGLVAE